MAKVSQLPKSLPNADQSMETALNRFASQTAFTISSTREPGMPIVYVSSEFCRMTGYTEKEILGRNCRFLQGAGTSRQSVQEIRNAIQEDRGCTVCLMNYTKDGKPFWNQLCLAPVRDEYGVACYLGIQTNVTGAVLAYRSQQFSPFQTNSEGPHGGVHSYTCPEIVAKEMEDAKRLEGTIRRWHSEKLESISVTPSDFRPVSSKMLPASLLTPLYKLHQSFVLADPTQPDMPIVHASEDFLRLTGRPRNQVVGHNCRFMQGPLTNQDELQKLRVAIKEERPITVRLLNYKANGELFWNNLHVAPIRDADGKVVFYAGCQLDITLKQPKPNRRHSNASLNPESPRAKIQATQNSSEIPTTGNRTTQDPTIPSMATIPEKRIDEQTKASVNNDPALKRTTELSEEKESEKSELLAILHGEKLALENSGQGSQTPHNQAGPQSSQAHTGDHLGDGVATDSDKKPGSNIQDPADDSAPAESSSLATSSSLAVPEAKQLLSPASRQAQRSVVGAVRVVCRSLSAKTGLRRSLEDQHLPHGMDDCARPQQPLDRKDEESSTTRIDMPNLGSSHL